MRRMRGPGLGVRLAIAFALLAASTALVTAAVSALQTSRQVNAEIDRFLESRSSDIAEGRRARPGARNRPPQVRVDTDDVQDLVDNDAVVQVLDPDGLVVISAGRALPIEMADLALVERRDSPLLRTVDIDGERFRMITRHVDGGGAVQVAQSLQTTNALLGDIRSQLVVVGVVLSSVAALVGWAVAQNTTRPLRRLTAKIEEVARTQNLETETRLERSDEIGRLSEEFDSLLASLRRSRMQQRQLVQDAAHELRTPLTSVRANIDFLARAESLPPADREATIASIRAELSELSAVLAEVVELATDPASSATFEPVDLASVADAALAQFELRSSRPVIRQLEPSFVQADRPALVRAAQNLITNADKYSPPGEPVRVTVSNGTLSVADHGPGIDAAERERVFDRFYRSDRDRSAPGSGLGLAIVAKAASGHGGRVWAASAPEGGAEVGFTLPEIPLPQN